MRNRFCFAACCLPIVVAIGAVALMVWITPTREERAIANLVNTGAYVVPFEEPNGNRFLYVDLHGFNNSDEPLSYIADIENVQGIKLNAEVHESGVKSLLRLRGLRHLDFYGVHFPPGMFAQLECDLKRNNPNLEIDSFVISAAAEARIAILTPERLFSWRTI
jgi:hypothetical protein